MMKPNAVLVNAARGPVIDEVALVAHLKANPEFRCGLDVFEDEPAMKPGLADCPNAVIVPHIASASMWTRSGMATLAAANVAAHLQVRLLWLCFVLTEVACHLQLLLCHRGRGGGELQQHDRASYAYAGALAC